MVRKNTRHRQIPLTSHVDELLTPLQERLQNSLAETLYWDFFCRLDEQPFTVLSTGQPSCPNAPVNVLVGLEVLKAANGWNDEEMYHKFCYNVQVRSALGNRHLGERYFNLCTFSSFREQLARHLHETGEKLLAQTFERVTDERLRAFSLKTGKQRMDSTLLASNIRQMERMQLLVTVLQQVWRVLSEEYQQRYADLFAPYLKRKRLGAWVLLFATKELQLAERRRRSSQYWESGRNPRAAVVSTVRSVEHPFAGGKASVSGCFRVACMVVDSAVVVNIRRLHRFWRFRVRPPQVESVKEGVQKRQPGRVEPTACSPVFSFVRMIRALRWRLLALQPLQLPALS